MELVLIIIFGIFGLWLLFGGLFKLYKVILLLKKGDIIQGSIVDFSKIGDADGSDTLLPIVEYLDENNLKLHRFESAIQKGVFSRYIIGESVEVIVTNTKEKQQCEINNRKLLLFGPIILIVSGLIIELSLLFYNLH